MKVNDKTQMASPKQIKYLHVLFRRLDWNEEMYREMLEYHYGVRSTKELTMSQAGGYITILHQVAEALNPMISEKQGYLVRKLWAEIDYSGGKEGDLHLNNFLTKYYKKNEVEELTKREAIKLIKQIKQMIKQAKEREGKTTILKRRTKCDRCGEWIMWVQLKDGRREAFDCDDNQNATNFHNCQ